MKVAVSMRVVNNQTYPDPRDAISHDWIRFLSHHKFNFVLIPNTLKDPTSYCDEHKITLVLLTNGNDLGESQERDNTEHLLCQYAIGKNIPVLGVCRGFQIINSFFGGGIVPVENHIASSHQVTLQDPRYLQRWHVKEFTTNSFHQYGVTTNTLAPDLLSFATSSDGVIEGFYHKKFPIVGVQWHPERSDFNDTISHHLVHEWAEGND